MCGRYILKQISDAERYFGLKRAEWYFKASFNIAPSQEVPVVRLGKDGVREGIMMRWGLIPYWAHGEVPKFSTINATIEKLETAAAWREPWERGRRCLIPANGFYEWVRREVACVIVRRMPFGRTCRSIGSVNRLPRLTMDRRPKLTRDFGLCSSSDL